MQIYVTRNGVQLGPFTETQLFEHVRGGLIHSRELAWHSGCAAWTPVGQLFPETANVPVAPIPAFPAPGASPAAPIDDSLVWLNAFVPFFAFIFTPVLQEFDLTP